MGLMDAIDLRQELDLLGTEFQRRLRSGESGESLLPTAQALEASARHLNIPDFIAVALMRRAEILAGVGRDAEVINVLEDARQVLGGWRKQDLGVRVLALLAETHARREDWVRVNQVCSEGIGLTERFRYQVSGPYLQSAYLRYRIGLYSLGVRSAYALGDHDLMLRRAELSKCRSLLRQQNRAEGSGFDPDTAVSSVEQAFLQVCTQIDGARSRGRNVADLLVKRRTLWDLVVIERMRARSTIPGPEFSLAAVQAGLGADETVLYYYWVTPGSLLIVMIDATDCQARLRTVSPEDRRRLEALADTVSGFTNGNRGALDAAADLGALLLPDLATPYQANRRRLLISPHRMLHSLPLHAIRWDDRWLIERFAITYIPNLTSLLQRRRPSNPPHLLLVGITDYDVPGSGQKLPALPQAEAEVTDIARICAGADIPVRLLPGAEAREQRLMELRDRGELERFSCLHFAVHGQNLNADTPMESHLFLRDSLLDGLEIANWRLNADLVVLSACCSGQRAIAGRGMAELPGDEMFGLSAAFFAAGARSIFSTLWPVDSAAAVPITTGLHRHLIAGLTPDRAWQETVCDYLRTVGPLRRKPFYWAPFFLSAVGRWGADKPTE